MPAQYPGGSAGPGDPLVLYPGATFNAWFSKVQEVAKRSWKSALIISAVGIAVPYAISGLVSGLTSWGTGYSVLGLGSFFAALGGLVLGWLLSLVIAIAGCFVAAAGWAAGTWALVQEAATGQQANVQQAFQYGLKRAMALFPWTVLAAVVFAIGSACLWLPGAYLAFGFSLFGFVAIFERGKNPVGRSFSLTHNSATFGPTLGKIAILIGAASVYLWILWSIETAIQLAVLFGTGGTFGYDLGRGVIEFFGGLLATPVFALLLIGLLPTYAELRARETPLSTGQLQQELG